MNWILIAYLLTLVWLAKRKGDLPRGYSLRAAWIWFALIPISHFGFTLIRAGNFPNPSDLALVEIWSDGVAWLFLGISMLCLTGAIDQGQGGTAGQ